MYGYVFNLLFTLYVVTKLGFSTLWTKLKIHTSTDILVTIPSLIVASVAVPISLVLLFIPWVYRQIAHVILMMTIGDKYLGLITGCNAVASLGEGKEPAAITLVLNVNSDKSANEIYSAIKDRIHDCMESPTYAKLFTVRKMYMGYIYLEKRNFHIEEIIGSIGNVELREFLNELCHKDMPQLNTGNLDVYVGSDRVKDGGYPIIIRIHHCLVDGLALYNILCRMFCIQNYSKDVYAKKISESFKRNVKEADVWESINRFRCASITSLFPVTCSNDIFSEKSGDPSDTILTYIFEREEKYVPTVKRIKKRFPGMHFSVVVLTAISASLAEFYMKKREFNEPPESIHTSLMAQVDLGRFNSAYRSGEETALTNDFSLLYPQITVIPTWQREKPIEEYLVERLLTVEQEYIRIQKSPEYITNYTMFNTLVSLVPRVLLKPLYLLGRMTVAFSLMPGGPTMKLFTGDEIQDVIFFTPKQAIMGICLTVFTYGDKFQLGIKANRSKCSNYEDLDAILQGVLKYIDILDRKTANY